MGKNTAYGSFFIMAVGALAYVGAPWWIVAAGAFAASWIFPQRALAAFAAAFAAGFALWSGFAWATDAANGGVLSARVGKIFMGLTGAQLVWITGSIGGLLAGLGALTATYMRDLLIKA